MSAAHEQPRVPNPADSDEELFPPLRGEEFGQPVHRDSSGVEAPAGHRTSGHGDDAHEDDACAQAIARVHAFLTNQLPASQADLIRAHLDACEKCLDDFDIEATISRLLKQSCGSPCAPESLRLRVMTLRVEDGTTDH